VLVTMACRAVLTSSRSWRVACDTRGTTSSRSAVSAARSSLILTVTTTHRRVPVVRKRPSAYRGATSYLCRSGIAEPAGVLHTRLRPEEGAMGRRYWVLQLLRNVNARLDRQGSSDVGPVRDTIFGEPHWMLPEPAPTTTATASLS
jgi:hypothetical protein